MRSSGVIAQHIPHSPAGKIWTRCMAPSGCASAETLRLLLHWLGLRRCLPHSQTARKGPARIGRVSQPCLLGWAVTSLQHNGLSPRCLPGWGVAGLQRMPHASLSRCQCHLCGSWTAKRLCPESGPGQVLSSLPLWALPLKESLSMSTWLIRPAWLRTWHLALLEVGPQQGQDRHSSMLGSPWTLARQMGHQTLLSQTGGSGTGMCSCASRSLLHRFTEQATPASRHTMTHTGEQMPASLC